MYSQTPPVYYVITLYFLILFITSRQVLSQGYSSDLLRSIPLPGQGQVSLQECKRVN